MGKTKRILHNILFSICVILLIIYIINSFFIQYEGENESTANYITVINEVDFSNLNANNISYLFDKAINIETSEMSNRHFFKINIMVMFVSLMLLPIFASISLILLLIYFIKKKKEKPSGIWLYHSSRCLVLSYLYNFLCVLCGLKSNRTVLMNITFFMCLAIMVILSELTKGVKYEIKISLFNKTNKLIILLLLLYLCFSFLNFIPEIMIYRAIFAVLTILIFNAIISSLFHVDSRKDISSILIWIIVYEILLIILAIYIETFTFSVLIKSLLIDVLIIIQSSIFKYYVDIKTLQYRDLSATDIMSGNHLGISKQKYTLYKKFSKRFKISMLSIVLKFYWKIFVKIGIVMLSHLIFYAVLHLLLNVKISTCVLVGNIFSFIFVYPASMYETFEDDDYIYDHITEHWRGKNSAVCGLFLYGLCALSLMAIFILAVNYKFPWNILDLGSVWNYLFCALSIHIILTARNISETLKIHSCSKCHFIDTIDRNWNTLSKHYQRHKKHIDGHYVTDKTTINTKYNTTGSGQTTYEGYYTGAIGFSNTSSTFETTKTSNIKTDRWVEGYDVDEGLYEHEKVNVECKCCFCGYNYKYTSTVEHKIE